MMDREQITAMLAGRKDYLSGEAISQSLGVTRAAVWKEINAMRNAGWPIASSPRLGYRLDGEPPVLSAGYLSALLGPGSLFAGKLRVLRQVDSTNTQLKALAAQGAPEGAALLAEEQTAGRGTHGRAFLSPRGDGLYLSVLLRPRAALSDLLTLTGWTAVAVCRGIEAASGAPVSIKWLNDIYLNDRKLCGILTELSLLGESAEPDYAVVGVGINVSQTAEVFRAQGLADIAASLAGEGWPVGRNRLAACVLAELERMYRAFPFARQEYLDQYRRRCLTPGQAVTFERDGDILAGTARRVAADFALIISGEDGRQYRISSGTVTHLRREQNA